MKEVKIQIIGEPNTGKSTIAAYIQKSLKRFGFSKVEVTADRGMEDFKEAAYTHTESLLEEIGKCDEIKVDIAVCQLSRQYHLDPYLPEALHPKYYVVEIVNKTNNLRYVLCRRMISNDPYLSSVLWRAGRFHTQAGAEQIIAQAFDQPLIYDENGKRTLPPLLKSAGGIDKETLTSGIDVSVIEVTNTSWENVISKVIFVKSYSMYENDGIADYSSGYIDNDESGSFILSVNGRNQGKE